MRAKILAATVVIQCVVGVLIAGPATADPAVIFEHSSSSSSSSDTSTPAGTETTSDSNKQVFNFHFHDRIKDLGEQIDLGLNKGWLSSDQANAFKQEQLRLDTMEKTVSQTGYPKDQLDILESGITALNNHLSSAMSKPAAAVKPAAAGDAKPAAAAGATKPVAAAGTAKSALTKKAAKSAPSKGSKSAKSAPEKAAPASQ